jgi:DNA polymerase-3 subunit beta
MGMKFSCTQENLKKALQITSTVAGKNINLPVLNNVLVKVEGSLIRFLTTNLEIAVSSVIRGKIEQNGELTVPSKLFSDFVNLLDEDKVDIEDVEGTLHVACRKNSTEIKGIPASEYPLIPTVERKTVFYLDAGEFKKALSQVTFAVSTIESRPELTGVFFNVNPSFASGKVVMAATDSYRLSERTISLGSSKDLKSTEKSFGVIIPGKTLAELSRILSIFKEEDDVKTVEIIMGESQIMFYLGDIEVISRVIEGKYPEYRPIIPEKFFTEFETKTPEVIQAVKSASLFSRAGLQDVHFDVRPGSGMKVLSSEGQYGKNINNVESEVKGKENSITVNYRYLLDGIHACHDDKVVFRMIDPMNPCVITPSRQPDGEKFQYIVMPIRA